MFQRAFFIAIVCLSLNLHLLHSQTETQPAEVVFHNGVILTMDDDRIIHRYLSRSDERVDLSARPASGYPRAPKNLNYYLKQRI